MTKMLKQLIYCISISQIIFSENVDNEEQEDRRNLSTDILDYVLQALSYEWKKNILSLLLFLHLYS